MPPDSGTRALIPVASTTRREIVVDTLRRAVLSGELKPGESMRESTMAALLNVSRPTVREAMNQLVHEGILQREPYRGIRVAETDDQALTDATEVRVQLETLAALRIARERNTKALRDIEAAVQRHIDAIATGDPVLIDSTHLDIHRCLWQESGNLMLSRIWPLVASQVQLSMTLDQVARSDPARDAQLHQQLVTVISRGDEREITAEVEAHIKYDGHRKSGSSR